MTFIPFTISFIRRILLSVLLAVLTLSLPNCLPTHATKIHKELTIWNDQSTLKRNCCDQQDSPNKSTWTNLLTEQSCDNYQLERSSPQVVIEKHRQVKPVNVVGQEVDHLANCSLPKCTVREFEGLRTFPNH